MNGLNLYPKKYYPKDFRTYFMVDPIETTIMGPDVLELLKDHDLTKDHAYRDKELNKKIEIYTPYLERGFEDDKRLYVSLVDAETGYGVFPEVYLSTGSIIGEYAGIITSKSANTDYAWIYHSRPLNKDGEEIKLRVDARISGNILRFINHSDEPNCVFINIPFRNLWRTLYIVKKPIMPHEQLSVDYGRGYWTFRGK